MELSEVKLTYTQEPDSCDNGDEQCLDVVVTDAGGGQYIYIRTDRWAVDSPLELVKLFSRVYDSLDRLGVTFADDQATDRS